MKRVFMFHPYMNQKARQNVDEVLRSRWIGEGEKVKEFEKRLKARFGFRYCVAVNSGTSAIRLALAMCGVGPGDEVITPAQTCTATNMPILEQFATPVFVDIQYLTGNIDPDDIEHRITERTKAIIVVDWAGYPADLSPINQMAKRHDLSVIEDAAHAIGALYWDAPVGNVSEFTAFSFQAIKQLTTGDGGLLTMVNQPHWMEARRRRWFGIDRENRVPGPDGYSHYDQAEAGYKMQMNDIAAAIGLGNLDDIDVLLAKREGMAFYYRQQFKDVPGVTLFEKKPDRKSSNWLFTMHVERRDDFHRAMKERGVETSVVHIRNDRHTIFGPRREDLPNTDRYEQTNISIPLHNMMDWEDCQYVADCVRAGW